MGYILHKNKLERSKTCTQYLQYVVPPKVSSVGQRKVRLPLSVYAVDIPIKVTPGVAHFATALSEFKACTTVYMVGFPAGVKDVGQSTYVYASRLDEDRPEAILSCRHVSPPSFVCRHIVRSDNNICIHPAILSSS